MINKKEYKRPAAEITSFECVDVITRSMPASLDKTVGSSSDYVKLESKSWSDIYGN